MTDHEARMLVQISRLERELAEARRVLAEVVETSYDRMGHGWSAALDFCRFVAREALRDKP